MPKFRKRPVVIEAVQWTGDIGSIYDFIQQDNVTWTRHMGVIEIETLEGIMTASLGDWIIRGVKGEYYPCKPDIFEKTYEPEEKNEIG